MEKLSPLMNEKTKMVFKELFDINNLELLSESEKISNKKYVECLIDYANGKADGIKLRNLSAGAATIAKLQQSRSAVARLKFDVMTKYNKE